MKGQNMRTPVVFVLCVVFVWSVSGNCATFEVDSTIDAPDALPGDGLCRSVTGPCTLRAAVMESNALAGADTILLPAGVYALTLAGPDGLDPDPYVGDLDIEDSLRILGESNESTIIDASQANDRVLSIRGPRMSNDPPRIELVGLTITGGTTQYAGGCVSHFGMGTLVVEDSLVAECSSMNLGGGISFFGYSPSWSLRVVDSMVSNNRAFNSGGGVYCHGELDLVRSEVVENRVGSDDSFYGRGGGVSGGPVMVIEDSDISRNTAGNGGGGVFTADSRLRIERSTVSLNRVLADSRLDSQFMGTGGGILSERTTHVIANSTISGNSAPDGGGGIFSERYGTFHIVFSTIVGNTTSSPGWAGMQMMIPEGWPSPPRAQAFRGTVIAGNLAAGEERNCFMDHPVESRGYNIDGDGSCGFDDPTDRAAIDPQIGPLADNGGVGETHGLYDGSPAIDLVPASDCLFLIDNDLDGKIDEDDIDGIDDDLDYRVDEDPPEPAAVDQRGAARPEGARCDAGSFEGAIPRSAEGLIEELIVDVEELIEAGAINYGRGRSLIAELQVALWFLEFRNGERIAAIRIELFIIKVQRLIDSGDLEEGLGNALLVKARSVLRMLQEASS